MKYLSELDLKNYRGQTALLRIDLNVEKGGKLDSYRLEATLPTMRLLRTHGIKIVILSHRGRPINNKDKTQYSLAPFGAIIAKKMGEKVNFIIGARMGAIKKAVENAKANIVLLENLRFFAGEETNDPTFSKVLAELGNFYVNDAFAVSHRKNASVCAITQFILSYAGLNLEQEIKNLNEVMKNNAHPFTIILGGAKIMDKLGVMQNFWNKADTFLLGSGYANMVLQGEDIQKEDQKFLEKIANSKKVIFPVDVKVGKEGILDIGKDTIKMYENIIAKSNAIIWNGPVGLFEKKGFEEGTRAVWNAILKNKKARIVIGGGETVASLYALIKTDINADERGMHPHQSAYHISTNPRLFLSTGGGAMLDYLSGKKLPGIEALKNL